MNLFHDNGHLTNEGLHAILGGTLDELESLEAAEHLSFCDTCLAKYTRLLDNIDLREPSTPLREPVMRRIKQRARTILFSRYTTVAAAALLAVAIWGTGLLSNVGRLVQTEPPIPQQPTVVETAAPKDGLGTWLNAALGNISDGISGVFQRTEATTQQPKEATGEETPPDGGAKQSPEDLFGADGGTQDGAPGTPDDTSSTATPDPDKA